MRSGWWVGGLVLIAACPKNGEVAQNGDIAKKDVTKKADVAKNANTSRTREPSERDACDFDAGTGRYALLVGVAKYANPAIPNLDGVTTDVEKFRNVLAKGYAFEATSTCVLADEDATKARFVAAMSRLTEAAKKDDQVVVYFAGHGSQAYDTNDDETDDWDETLMFYDARTETGGDLVDDEFSDLLAKLHAKTTNVTIVLDACNSGTATRSDRWRTRYFDPLGMPPVEGPPGDTVEGWLPPSLPGFAIITGSADGTAALENDDGGVLTAALTDILIANATDPLTYGQLARKLRSRVASISAQIPGVDGDLQRRVFGADRVRRPLLWEVSEVDGGIVVSGVPTPGFSAGALARVYDGRADATKLADPSESKGTLRITSTAGFGAKAEKVSGDVAIGDVLVLMQPGRDAVVLSVAIDLANADTKAVEDAIAADERYAQVLKVDKRGAYAVRRGVEGGFEIVGPEGDVRNRVDASADAAATIAKLLALHARQRALLALASETGSTDDARVEAKLLPLPAAKQPPCAKGTWVEAEGAEIQTVPLCHKFMVEVRLSGDGPRSIGGVILSNDGSITGFPLDGRAKTIYPDKPIVFFAGGEAQAAPPLRVLDHILVFTTPANEPVAWHLLDFSKSRGKTSDLHARLTGYLTGARGVKMSKPAEDSRFGVHQLSFRVQANSFADVRKTTKPEVTSREYTVRSFDIRPYLPTKRDSALYRVLRVADWLTNYRRESEATGVAYCQHDWKLAADADNLARGIDCSRSVWFAFTRAGLELSDSKWHRGYLSTKLMAKHDGPMKDHFVECTGTPLRTGDLIVQRRDDDSAGHVVMVIDPEQRVAWGSHGFDGTITKNDEKLWKDTGVEYQQIRYKKDWERWDSSVKRVACWRHKTFVAEWDEPGARPAGTFASAPCVTGQCRASLPAVAGIEALPANIPAKKSCP